MHLLLNLANSEGNLMKELNTLLYNFLWGGKTDKIKRSGMCQGYAVSGLKMVDVKIVSQSSTVRNQCLDVSSDLFPVAQLSPRSIFIIINEHSNQIS